MSSNRRAIEIEEIEDALGKLIVGLSKSGNLSGKKFKTIVRELYKDLIKGFKLVEDTAETEIPISDLEIVPLLKSDDETLFHSEAFRCRAEELGAKCGFKQAQYMLVHQREIPKKWEKIDHIYLPFPGTVWRHPSGDLCVPYLSFREDYFWSLEFLSIDQIFNSMNASYVYLLRPRK